MKVLHVELGRHLYGGARQVVYLVNGLADRAIDQVLVTCTGAELIPAVKSTVRILPLPFGGDADLPFIWRLFNAIRRENPDVLHIHSRRGDLVSTLAGLWAGVAMIHSRRVDNPPRWLDLHGKFPCYRKIITISEGIRRVLMGAGVDPAKLVCVRSAVDTERFRPSDDRGYLRQVLNLPDGGFNIGMIAQLIPRKGHENLLDAFPTILEKHPSARLLIFGRGPLEGRLKALVAERGLCASVYFVGFRDDMDRLLPCLDLVVHPASMEGLGVALLEAASCGVPVIATCVGGIPEVVAHGETGYLLPLNEIDTLARVVTDLLADDAQRLAMGRKSRAASESDFPVSRMVSDNLAQYLAVAAPR